jgi:transposase
LKSERTGHLCRIRSLFVLHGINPTRLPVTVRQVRDFNGESLPVCIRAELEREYLRLEMTNKQIAEIEGARDRQARESDAPNAQSTRKLHSLKGIGIASSGLLVDEFFAWREFRNRREVGALSGLVGAPYDSGDQRVEQGISKAGNRRVRTLMIEMAWRWLQFQPGSALSRWFQERYGSGTRRMRRIGIVALARKLLVALWKYLKFDECPEGAVVVTR